MAYYACLGKHPFDGDRAQVERAIREAAPLSPLKSEGHVHRSIAVIIMACLEKAPGHRPTMERVARVFADSASLFD